MMTAMATGGSGDPHTQMNTYRSYVTMLADLGAKDEIKLKAAQELSENFEVILNSPQYPQFLDHSLKIFLKILQDGEPHFIAEYNIQQVRKLILEMIHRLPMNETLRPYLKSILILMLKLMEIENEENVLVCLKIFMELHKHYRPQYSTDVDIHKFLQWVKCIYSDLPNHLPKIFEPKPAIRVKDLSEISIDQLLQETYTTTPIHTEKKLMDGSVVTYNLIPRSVLSLKVIQELPIIVVLMYQLYKQNVHQEVSNFIPLIMETITLQPAANHRQSAAFNKEVFVDFMGAQIKTLAFLAYIIRIYQETIANHATLMVKGIIGLLTLCPPEVAHLRKELVIATRHVLATDLRLKFVPYMERLFDEDVLLGRGWTVHESLRPLAYSTLADLVHHVRQHLPLTDLALAAHLFAKNVHDESLPTSIQTMSCKLLLNMVDCVRQRSEAEGTGTQPQGRQLLMRILEVFVLKFKTISKLQLPALMAKCKQTTVMANGTTPSTPTTPAPAASTSTTVATSEVKLDEEKPSPDYFDSINKPEEKSKIGFPNSYLNNLNVGDYRTLVKTLVCGAKTITWGCASCKQATAGGEGTSTSSLGAAAPTGTGQKQFSSRETLVFIRLVRWGLQSLDIYTLAAPRAPAMPPAQPHVRSKEEKEVLEHFSGVFSMMNPQTFQEIFTATISHMVERINKNMTLQIIANTFLSNPATSPIFATVLVEYLLKRMEEMGTNVERSNLYLRLFKLVFGSVSLFPTENEQMLRPHLHSIVNKAMDYAMTAKEPYNYFLLLRALFRSIGGGSHDLLYQEFLPLLPNLLEGLNRLQSGLHKQHMKDLFVELCLTVPVRLSSLLPYLPMLMDPLVSALNGSHTLISQGLRTLELCVDNLQPDFLYEHIQPVRADLMQALWRTLQNNEVARIAFRVLGKFGGGNRKMMIEPQRLEYRETDAPPPAVLAYFQEQPKPIDFEVDKIIETAFTALKSSTTEPYYRRQCWEVLRCYLAATLNLEDDRATLYKLLNHPSFVDGKIPPQNGPYYKCSNAVVRNTHRTALTGMFVAAAIKELRQHVLSTMVSLVRHYTLVAIAQEAGPFAGTGGPKEGLDALVLIDAIAVVMGHEEKELCKPGHLALVLIIETAATVLGSKERACRLPLMEYLAERMSSLCYERAWYAKLGGCIAVKFMLEKMAPEWVYKHVFTFLKAVLFVMMDLTGELSSEAIDMATINLERLVRVCVTGPSGQTELEPEVAAAKTRALHDVLQELVLQITSPHLLVRQQSMKSLELTAQLQNKTVTEVMDPHREAIADIIPPKKHLLRHQPANAQMGLMDGTTFCTTLNPRLFTIDLNINEHKVFFRELISLCDGEDAMLGKLPCYKGVNLVPLRISALRALASCHYIQEKPCREKIFQVLYKSLEKNDPELQQAGFECMQKFLSGFQIDMEMVHPVMRPLLLTLGDHRNLSVNGAKRLSYLTQLFPSTFSEKLCEQLLQLLKKLLDYSIQTNRGGNFLQSVSKNMDNEQKIIILVGIFHQIPAASPRFIDVLCRLILHTEKSLSVEAGSPFREPLVKFLLRYPKETLDLMMNDINIKDQQWSRFIIYLIKHPEAGPAFREALQTSKKPRLQQLLAVNNSAATAALPQTDRNEMQFQAIRIISLLIKYDDQWLSGQHELMELLKRIWCSDSYHEMHKKVENVDCTHWKEPKLIVKILLHYFCHHPSNIDLLFQLLRALCDRFIPDFQFLRDFLEHTVAQNYTVEWKRSAFFRFVEHFSGDAMSQDLKAKVLQMILIPCFAVSFEKGQKIVGGPPAPYQDNPDNVVSVFINNVIDPENPFACSDGVRISLLQFACLLLEQASAHIHDANNKKQGNKLRRLMTFAWPCLLGKNYVDPATRYHGHLLLSHIIAKFAIHKRIVLQVFHSLLKAHALEARVVVRQALEILTPAMPQRMEDGNTMLTHWTKKIIVEDGHSTQQLYHILQLVVRHYKVYYPVRHALVAHMVSAMQRLGFSTTATAEQRRLAVDLAEVALKWELQRIRDHAHDDTLVVATSPSGAVKRMSVDESGGEARKALNTGWASPQASTSRLEPDAAKPLDRAQVDIVVNLLLRLACQVNEGPVVSSGLVIGAAGAAVGGSPGEQLSRRCDKYEELESLYACVSKYAFEGLATYEKSAAGGGAGALLGPLMMLKACCASSPGYVDRLLLPLMRVLQRMLRDHVAPNPDAATSDLLILALDLLKARVSVMPGETRKTFIGTVLVGLIEKTTDAKVMRAIIRMVEDWVKWRGVGVSGAAPSLREKSILLVKLMQYVEKRFPDDLELNGHFLDLINYVYSEDRKSFVVSNTVKEESAEGFSETIETDKEDVLDMDLDSNSNQKDDLTKNVPNRQKALNRMVATQSEFLEMAGRVRTEQLVAATAQLCHMDDALAHHIWLRFMPKIWSALDERQLETIMAEVIPFLISGVHVIQRDQPLSALNTFVEALARCNPPITMKPPMMKYLGKTHNLWHRMTLNLEQMAIDQAAGRAQRDQFEIYDHETESITSTEILDSLGEMYELLQEEDMWSGLWQKHAKYRETTVAIAYEQQGFFEQAQAAYDVAMAKLKQEYLANQSSYSMHKECSLWTQHWIKCAKELNQWDSLLELGVTRGARDPFLILESSWRNPNWPTMKEALAEVEYGCPKELAWLVNLYRGYLCICSGGEQQLGGVERHAEAAATQCLREWRRLPRLVSHAHLPLLRAAQQLMELSEAAQIHTGLLHSRPTSLHDMKAIVKTWRNRLPVVADPLSHWGAIFTWRQHHYQFIASHYDSQTDHASNHSMLGVHASAQAIIHFAKIARKHNLSGVCLDSLHRIYTIPSVPIVDCFQKIRQQVKCHIQMSWTEGRDELTEGLEMIESTNFKYFTKEMTAEFYAFKGLLLAQLGRSEDANKAFAAAVQLHDTLVKAWALWGDYLEQIFIRDPRQISVGVSAMTCFLHACRHQNESKSRKYCAKVLWMLSFDDEKNSLAEALDKYSVGVPPVQWLPWIPQLLACIVQYDGNVILNLLSHVGRLYPQAVYFPIRTLYLTLKIEQRERHKSAENIASHLPHQPPPTAGTAQTQQGARPGAESGAAGGAGAGEAGTIKATMPMWRCSKIMQLQREIHPTVLSSLEGIVDQMVWFRENWYEEVLRQLRAGLAKCHVVAFHHRAAVADATVTPHTLNFVKKVVSTFGISIGITASESLARRAQATVQDPVFQKMKTQFTADFDFTQPNAMKLQNLIQKLRKWVKILEAKTKVLPKSFLIEEKCRFLSNFNLKTAEIELPGEFLLPKHTHYHVRIARFMPRVEIVQKHNTSARRLYIRGHNGKIYPYLVVNDSGLGDARREERVLQLLRMLNHYLGKQKETSRRFLHFTVPRVVSVSPQMRLVEDNPSSISLLDIYRTECTNRGVEYDAPIARYYERLAAVQARGSQASHQVLRDILREVQATMVPKGMVREWAAATFAAPTDYWTFRKMLTLQLSLAAFAEYVLHLTRLSPDMMYVHQDSGLLNVAYFKFDVDDTTGELDGNRPVPFRLTPNISELLTNIGITGPLTASAIAVARCLVTPNFKIQSILRTILRDEMVTGYRKRLEDKPGLTAGTSNDTKPVEMDNETIVNMVNKAVTVIMNRLNSLALFDGPDSKVATLVTAANSHDNLCRMDPAWHPWL
ncbi:Transformation/transcription domain-associated protein [Papilio machaon]|uniref:Transformation/transcription domain-associated protein n=1 Tax=Papilio machaon TaxID=76193 RepID=A0A194R3V2_PAPMA|nr:Transformation/transcription domain-associated protein [Papilio machaon]